MKSISIRAIALFCAILSLSACNSDKKKFEQGSKLSHKVEESFCATFPSPLRPFSRPPEIGRIGAIFDTENLQFITYYFPPSEVSRLESWLPRLVTSLEVQSISVSYFGVDEHGKLQASEMGRLRAMKNGTTTHETGLPIEEAFANPSAHGKLIK